MGDGKGREVVCGEGDDQEGKYSCIFWLWGMDGGSSHAGGSILKLRDRNTHPYNQKDYEMKLHRHVAKMIIDLNATLGQPPRCRNIATIRNTIAKLLRLKYWYTCLKGNDTSCAACGAGNGMLCQTQLRKLKWRTETHMRPKKDRNE